MQNHFNTNVSIKPILIFLQLVVFLGWFVELVLHQTWLPTIGSKVSWHLGMIIFTLIACIPLYYNYALFKTQKTLPDFYLYSQDYLLISLLIILGILYWYTLSAAAIYYPMHTYGDESFHTTRVPLMAKDFHTWFQHFFHHAGSPEFRMEYMFYPALAYVPVTLWNMLFGDPSSVVDQRLFLVVHYLLVAITTYIFARIIIKSKLLSFTIALIPLSSALLLAYTMSFYIELHYVGILILSFSLLALGIRKKSQELVVATILVASLAPIIRESALPGTFGIILATALWRYLNIGLTQMKWQRILNAGWYLLLGLIPFILYYLAKTNTTDWDKSRTSLVFILQQDYLALLSYAFLYLSPLFFVLFLFFLRPIKLLKQEFYLILAALIGIFGSLFMQAIFEPGYMPWTRNYLFYYAQFIVLLIIILAYIKQKFVNGNNIALILTSLGVISNIYISVYYLPHDKFFHESEVVFDFRPITQYINTHQVQFDQQTIYLYWPKGFPTYPEKLLPSDIKLAQLKKLPVQSAFIDFASVHHALPSNTRYLLFYWLHNTSRPKAFNTISAIARPTPEQLKDYRILVESTDPWSEGRNGVMLLEKIS